MGGTALIDVPLCAYRHHGANYFAQAESLAWIRQGTRQYEAKSRDDTHQTLELLLQDVDGFGWQLGDRYWPVLLQLDRITELRGYYRHPTVERAFTKHADSLRSFFGDWKTFNMLRARYDVWAMRRIFKRGVNKKGRSLWARFWLLELRHRLMEFRRRLMEFRGRMGRSSRSKR